MKELTNDNYKEEIKNAKAALVEFYSPTCGHCKVMKKTLEGIEGDYEGKVAFYGIDIFDTPDAISSYDISSVPTFLIIKDGQIRDKFLGETHKLILEQALSKLG